MSKLRFLFVCLISFFSMFVISCSSSTTLVDDYDSYAWIDVNLGFMPNIEAVFDSSLTNPSPGVHGFLKNETVTLSAVGSDKYVFVKWKVMPAFSDSFEVFEDDYSFVIDKNYIFNVYFGCASDDACADGFVCLEEEFVCVEKFFVNASFFRIGYSNFGFSSDISLSTNVLAELNHKGYVVNSNVFLIEDVDALFLFNDVFLAVFEGEVLIIVGTNMVFEGADLVLELNDVLIDMGVPSQKIRVISSDDITNSDLLSLF